MYNFVKEININSLRNPKIINYKKNLILIGSKIYQENENKKKYLLFSYILDENFNLINDTEKILNFENIEKNSTKDINISCWIRDIYNEDEYYYLLVEFKQNHNNEYFTSNNYYLRTLDFNDFEIYKKYNMQDLFFKEYENNLFISKIINTEHFWGSYFFEFIINNQKIRPIFDKFVKYEKNEGHLLHDLKKINNIYYILFSIRHFDKNEKNNFYYKIYEAESLDLINYTNTKELDLDIKDIDTKWLCYPWKFKINNNQYIIFNQDDFGKEKKPLLFKYEK